MKIFKLLNKDSIVEVDNYIGDGYIMVKKDYVDDLEVCKSKRSGRIIAPNLNVIIKSMIDSCTYKIKMTNDIIGKVQSKKYFRRFEWVINNIYDCSLFVDDKYIKACLNITDENYFTDETGTKIILKINETDEPVVLIVAYTEKSVFMNL